jgi:DNA-binding Xre family transcriptional regulator
MYEIKKLNKGISEAVKLLTERGSYKPLSQLDLATKAGIAQSGLSSCLSGVTGWKISQLAAVCNGLNVTIEDILLIAKELQVLKNAKHVFPRPTLVRGLELGSDERLQVLMDVAYAGNRAVAQMFDVEALKRFIPEKYEAYKNCILSDAEMYCEIVQQVDYLIKNIRLITALSNKSDTNM